MSGRRLGVAVRDRVFRADVLFGLATLVMVGQLCAFLLGACGDTRVRTEDDRVRAAANASEVPEADDPIAALGAPVASARFGREYWIAVSGSRAAADSITWRRALAICGTGTAVTDRPNCNTVRYVATVRGWGPGANTVPAGRDARTTLRVEP